MIDQNVTLATVFLAGVISFLSPCVLPILPTYSAFLAGSGAQASDGKINLRFWLNAVSFLTGFTLVFVIMGATASYFGQLLLEYQQLIQRIGAVFMIIMGIQLAGFIRFNMMEREYRPLLRYTFQGPIGAFLLGTAFTIGWTPCTGPILATVLVYAGTAATLSQGAFLLFVYAMGFCIPFLILAALLQRYLLSLQSLYAWLPAIQRTAGVILVLVGVFIYFDLLQKGIGVFWRLLG